MQKLLLTGAAGRLGSVLRPHLGQIARKRRLNDIIDIADLTAEEEVSHAQLGDFDAVRDMVAGCDGIIHLGGIAVEDSFDAILDANITGTYNIYEAARQTGIQRILFASSNHATGFHPIDTRLDADSVARPDSLYGASKVWGEAIANLYYDKYGIETAKVRIGSCWPKPRSARELKTWLSHADFVRLTQHIFSVPELECPLIYGVSANTGAWWDNSKVAHLGWRPQDSADVFHDEFPNNGQRADMDDPAEQYQGGAFAADGKLVVSKP